MDDSHDSPPPDSAGSPASPAGTPSPGFPPPHPKGWQGAPPHTPCGNPDARLVIDARGIEAVRASLPLLGEVAPKDTSGCCYQRAGGCEQHRKTPPNPAAMLGEAWAMLDRARHFIDAAGHPGLADEVGVIRTRTASLKREAEAREGRCEKCGGFSWPNSGGCPRC